MDRNFGLASILPDVWEQTPWYLRIFGVPAYRSWRQPTDQGYWLYADTKPAVTYGGIDRSTNPIWNTKNG